MGVFLFFFWCCLVQALTSVPLNASVPPFIPLASHLLYAHNEDWCLNLLAPNSGKQKLRQRPSQLAVPSGFLSSVASPDV